jgi:galactose mutarotase-like enzyme
VLSDDGLEGALRARNLGAEPAPFGAGFHPCVTVGDARSVRILEPGAALTGRWGLSG